jgi:hypothetical protein
MLCWRGRNEPPVGGDGSGEEELSFTSATALTLAVLLPASGPAAATIASVVAPASRGGSAKLVGRAFVKACVDEDDAAGTSVAEDCVASEETGSEVPDNVSEEDTDGAVVAAAAAAAGTGEVSSFCGVPDLALLCGDDTDAATGLILSRLLPAADLEGVSALNAWMSCAAEA